MKKKIVIAISIILAFTLAFSVTLEEIRQVSKEDPEKAFELLVKYLKSHPKDKGAQQLGKIIAAKRYLVKISPIADAVKKEDVHQLIRSMASLTNISIKTMDYIEVVFPNFYDTLREMTMKLDESAFRTCSIVPYRVREPKEFYKLVVDTYFASPLQFDPKKIEELKCMNLPRIKSNIKKYLENFLNDEDYYIKILNLSDMLLIEPPHATDLRLYYDLSYKLTTVNVNGLTPDDFKDFVNKYEKINLKKEKLSSKLREIYIKLSEKYDLSFCKDRRICPKIEVLKKKEERNQVLEKETPHSTISTPVALISGKKEEKKACAPINNLTSESSYSTLASQSNITKTEVTNSLNTKMKRTLYISLLSLAGAMVISLIFLKMKDPLKKIRRLKKKIAMNPTDPSLHFKLAELYEEIGRTEDAIKEYQLASKLFNEQQPPFGNNQKEP